MLLLKILLDFLLLQHLHLLLQNLGLDLLLMDLLLVVHMQLLILLHLESHALWRYLELLLS